MICGTMPRSAPHRASCVTFAISSMICGIGTPRSTPRRCTQRASQRPCPSWNLCGILTSPDHEEEPLRHDRDVDDLERDIDHLVEGLQLGNHNGLLNSLDHEELCHNRDMSSTAMNCNCVESAFFCTQRQSTCRCKTTGRSPTCKN